MKYHVPVVGSSAKMTEGLAISSHASDNLFFSPPLIPRTFASPTCESAQLTFKRNDENARKGKEMNRSYSFYFK